MKKFLSKFILIFLFGCFLVSCGSDSTNIKKEHLKIGVTSIPHGKILENVKKIFNLDFEIINYVDYEALNRDLISNKIQGNFFQTLEYMKNFNLVNNTNLIDLARVHVEPLIIYSSKYKSVHKINDGAVVYIPNDKINRNRALKLLEEASLIKLIEDVGDNNYIIIENPKNLIINEVSATSIPNYYDESDLVILNTNIALENSIFPHKDGIFYEDSFFDENKFNVFVTRDDLRTSVELKEIARHLNEYDTFKFINSNYKGFIKPVF